MQRNPEDGDCEEKVNQRERLSCGALLSLCNDTSVVANQSRLFAGNQNLRANRGALFLPPPREPRDPLEPLVRDLFSCIVLRGAPEHRKREGNKINPGEVRVRPAAQEEVSRVLGNASRDEACICCIVLGLR